MTTQMRGINHNNATNLHWKILVELTEQFKLPDSKYESAVERYENVAKWLNDSEDPIFKDATIYVQGSVKLGTTVKPYKKSEYDIDLIVHLPNVNETYESTDIHKSIGDRLRVKYKDKVSGLKRGWRIDYQDDFHLDITPAIPDKQCNLLCPINREHAEFVPDKNLSEWKASNPKGYYKWFHEIDKLHPIFESNAIVAGLESRSIEKVPDQHEFKGVLKRTVQILKRHRDIYFNEFAPHNKDYAPISIIITTLAAHAYEDLLKKNVEYTSVSLLKAIIKNMGNYINQYSDNNHASEYHIDNPTNKKENFAEKWNDDSRYALNFAKWSKVVYEDIESILSTEGVDKIGKEINTYFGASYGNKVIKSINESVNKDRANGVIPGVFALGASESAAMTKNTFYGA